jgi:hypothetical protein
MLHTWLFCEPRTVKQAIVRAYVFKRQLQLTHPGK